MKSSSISIRGWFFNLLAQLNPELSNQLHDGIKEKPFTLSSIIDNNGNFIQFLNHVKKGEQVWIRLTTFEDKFSEFTINFIIPNLPHHISLYKKSFEIIGWTIDPSQHKLARHSSFDKIISIPKTSRALQVEFLSPTAFRSNKNDIPLPIPKLIFQNWWKKWNIFAPKELQIHNKWVDFAMSSILISELKNINTVCWNFSQSKKGAVIGFTGKVKFMIAKKNHWLSCFQSMEENPSIIMNSLSEFAFYSGTGPGHHTSLGLGQTNIYNF